MRRRDIVGIVALAGVLGLGNSHICFAADGERALVRRLEPVYPELARQMRVGGVVVLRIVIEPDGHVSEVKVQSGHPLLVQAAVKALHEWKYAASTEPSNAVVSVSFIAPR